ncbi:hypothetical protein BHU72_08105 [Desulfuribacillus stibiiarsenatis]|uniref:Uncharacterized protein n=1 Tax=Desulfuribacillus stibiiarsenatis TaxID=1390249 RepID=A0A1E5L3U8_9FIRM|nr:hypothetical protein [Desulfuribacillus stibiiarsenatis]OEH84787.1 hypothetical protein BHU72_08105 [Desulfuribacillus stibiiarsenatis]
MVAILYGILAIIFLVTSLVTFLSYKQKSNYFKFWAILLGVSVVAIVAIAIVLLITSSPDVPIEQPPMEVPVESSLVAPQVSEPNSTSSNGNSFLVMLLMLGIYILINSILAVFAYRDASARAGITGGVAWAIIIFFFSIIGLGIYLLIRPVGNLMVCGNCKRVALDALPYCPHCHATLAKNLVIDDKIEEVMEDV